MNTEELEKEYRARPDDELLRLALTSEQLTSEANAALARELSRRGITEVDRLNLAREQSSQSSLDQNPRAAGVFARLAHLPLVEIRESWRRFCSLSSLKQLGIVTV